MGHFLKCLRGDLRRTLDFFKREGVVWIGRG